MFLVLFFFSFLMHVSNAQQSPFSMAILKEGELHHNCADIQINCECDIVFKQQHNKKKVILSNLHFRQHIAGYY